MKLRTAFFLTLIGIFTSLPALAITLDEARRTGSVGERYDGLLTILKPAEDINALVADINTKRMAEYKRISKENGQSIDVVSKLAAEQIINKLPAGSVYQAPDNGWKTK